MIQAQHISKKIGEQEILKDISWTIEQGKCNLLLGASGSGKTVFLKCLVGLMDIDKGNILFDDKSITHFDTKAKFELAKNMGVLFQFAALFDNMNIEENIMFPLNLHTNWGQQRKKNRVDEVLAEVQLKGVNLKMPSELSGGMRKRAGLARAIVLQPKYLLCDEPNSGLDPHTSRLIDLLIAEITKKYNMNTLVVTHDMNTVFNIGEKILFIQQGENIWEGTLEKLRKTENQLLKDFVFNSNVLS